MEHSAVRRLWIPAVILGLAAAAVGTLWAWPDLDRGQRTGTVVFMVVPVTLLMLTAWLLLLSGMRWPLRLGVLVGVIALVMGTVSKVEFDSEMMPIFHFRWEGLNDLTLEAHRAGRQKALPIVKPFPTPQAEDYPEFRNRARDGVISIANLNTDWKAEPPKELWRQPCGGGYAGFAVIGPIAVTIEQRRDDEAIVCYDTETGRERWIHTYPAKFAEILGGDGPRATPTIADGEVYSLGGAGMLKCLDAATGGVKWEVNIIADNDNIQWGMAGSPLVYDRVVVVNRGAQRESAMGKAVVAYDRQTGEVRWTAGDRRAAYSSPQHATLGGVRQILLLDGEAIAAFDAETGKELWSYPWKTEFEINVAQPLVLDGDRVLVSAGYNHGCALLKPTNAGGKWSVDELWHSRNLRCKFTSPVVHNGFIYGMDEGILTCIDPKDGQRKWKEGRYGNGQVLLAGDYLIVGDEGGKLVLVKASPERYQETGRIAKALPGIKNWNHLAVARGRAYLRNHFEMACYDLTMPMK